MLQNCLVVWETPTYIRIELELLTKIQFHRLSFKLLYYLIASYTFHFFSNLALTYTFLVSQEDLVAVLSMS